MELQHKTEDQEYLALVHKYVYILIEIWKSIMLSAFVCYIELSVNINLMHNYISEMLTMKRIYRIF